MSICQPLINSRMKYIKQSVKYAATRVQRLLGMCTGHGRWNKSVATGWVSTGNAHPSALQLTTHRKLALLFQGREECWGAGGRGSRYSCLNVPFMLKRVQNRNYQYKHQTRSKTSWMISTPPTPQFQPRLSLNSKRSIARTTAVTN